MTKLMTCIEDKKHVYAYTTKCNPHAVQYSHYKYYSVCYLYI